MLSGKPTMTFGSGNTAITGKARDVAPQSVRGKLAAEFASYMAKAEANRGAEATSVTADAAAPVSARSQVPTAKVPLGYPAETYGTPTVQSFQAGSARPMVAGTKSFALARAETNARFNAGFNAKITGAAAPSPGRDISLAQAEDKPGPRISGQPITGRRNITMGRRDVSKITRSATPPRTAKAVADDKFTAYGLEQLRAIGSQSFIAQGFAGRNAERALKSLGYDLRDQAQLMTQAKLLAQDSSDSSIRFPQGEEAARMAVLTASHKRGAERPGSLLPVFTEMAQEGLGSLAARYESGAEGIAAIGYDRKGGTSYGKYQIASRTGTMSRFIEYMEDKAPDLAKRLAQAGPANTGSRGGRMPQEWRRIASEEPQRFEALQSEFIRTSHYEPAMNSIARQAGVSPSGIPTALQEVVFSTAVQHGPAGAVRIVSQAIDRVGSGTVRKAFEKSGDAMRKAGGELIRQIYALRAGQFSSSTNRVQTAVKSRLNTEMHEALQLLS